MRTVLTTSTLLLLTILGGCMGGSEPLAASFTVTPLDDAKTRFRFDATASTGDATDYEWDFGDRTEPVKGRMVEHQYEHPNGVYKVRLTLRSGAASIDTFEERVTVGTQPNTPPLLYLRADARRAAPETPVLFDASQSFDADGDPLFFEWDFNSKLEQSAFDDLENLGNQQYGRYPEGKPAPTANGTVDGGEGSERTPSGHAWQKEVDDAWRRLLSRAGIDRLDGDHSVPIEPRNSEFDGLVEDEGPIQFMSFPSPATYFVHVKVKDIKGEGQEGFIRIRVQDQVPASNNTTTLQDTLEPAAFAQVQEHTSQHRLEARIGHAFRYEYAATTTLQLDYVVSPEQGDELVAVYVCGATVTFADCSGGTSKAKLEPGAPGRSLTWQVTPDEVSSPYTYIVYIANTGNAVVEYESMVSTVFDLNPWAREEAGYQVGH